LPGQEDSAIWEYFATASMPSKPKADAVLTALGSEPQSTRALESQIDLKPSTLELLLKVLDVDGAVRRVAKGWVSTGRPWVYDEERYERISAARRAEQRAMLDYETTSECRMTFLQKELDDPTAEPCGRCDRCAGAWYPSEVASGAAASVATALDRVGVEIEPRKLWPTGADRLGVPVRGKIAPGELLAPGRALARLTDLGWGGPLRELLATDAEDRPCPPHVLAACIRVLADWNWDERPAAVVSMPSRRRPLFIRSIAKAFADAGRLPYLGELDLLGGGPTGEAGGNSAFRLSAVWERFGAASLELPAGSPVLLVDDLVDSRWSITVAGRTLRLAGASAVLPFAAALRS